MNSLDILISLSIEQLGRQYTSAAKLRTSKGNSYKTSFDFGQVAFFKELVWSRSSKYRKSKSKRRSHPGLCISKNTSLVSFGSSKTEGREKNDPKLFFVNSSDSPILSSRPETVFLLFYSVPASIWDIDTSKSTVGDLQTKTRKRLRKRIRKHFPRYLDETSEEYSLAQNK